MNLFLKTDGKVLFKFICRLYHRCSHSLGKPENLAPYMSIFPSKGDEVRRLRWPAAEMEMVVQTSRGLLYWRLLDEDCDVGCVREFTLLGQGWRIPDRMDKRKYCHANHIRHVCMSLYLYAS